MASCALFSQNLFAQLAITEMMSARLNPADYFELTNFGTNVVDLANYFYTDADHGGSRFPLVPTQETVLLQPGESMVFVRTNLDEAEFRSFWGPCLDPEVKVRSFRAPGFSSFGDELLLYDGFFNLADRAEFGRAALAQSFVYDPATGEFGKGSPAVGGACLSTTNNSVGSPGRTTGPVPLQIIEQPAAVEQCSGLDTLFSVKAIGMPRPQFQWLYNGAIIPGAREETLAVPNMSASTEGVYSVLVSNGLSNILSAPARLVLSRRPAPPAIVSPPRDRTVVEGRTARFALEVCGYPEVSYRWSLNGRVLPGETNRLVFFPNCRADLSGSVVCVSAENEFGRVEACARLYVTNIAPIRLTELQANPQPGCDGHNDWFEITNFSESTVQLQGYRFSDHPTLDQAQVIKRPIQIRPQESIIFVKSSSVGTFFEWWGADQLPADLQVLSYSGFSLSARGEALYLWDETAERTDEFLDSVSYLTNSAGRTLNFESLDADSPFDRDPVETSAEGIRAVQCGDLGTPGFTAESWRNHARPQFTGIERVEEGTNLRWSARPGAVYRLEFSDDVSGPWQLLQSMTAKDYTVSLSKLAGKGRARFFRVIEVSP